MCTMSCARRLLLQATEFMKELSVRELPGVGYKLGKKLKQTLNVSKCKDLLQYPKV